MSHGYSEIRSFIGQIAHSPIRNYIVPGLISWLIGNPDPDTGCVRMFEMKRNQDTLITPHSHRFDFHCLVLEGTVTNTVFEHTQMMDKVCDQFDIVKLTYKGVGQYERETVSRTNFVRETNHYGEGDTYSMLHDEFHSIQFSKGARVLFFEGPYLKKESFALLPVVDGHAIDTLKTEPWMFLRDTRKLAL